MKSLILTATFTVYFIAHHADVDAFQFSGRATYHNPSMGIGACGWLNTDSEFVAAVSNDVFGYEANPNNAAVCGKCAVVQVKGTTKSVKVKVTDKCPLATETAIGTGCRTQSIDLSPAAFQVLAPLAVGVLDVQWRLEDCGSGSPFNQNPNQPIPYRPLTPKKDLQARPTKKPVTGRRNQKGIPRVCDHAYCVSRGLGIHAIGPCEGAFCKCGSGFSAFKENCPATLYFDHVAKFCNRKEDVKGCQ